MVLICIERFIVSKTRTNSMFSELVIMLKDINVCYLVLYPNPFFNHLPQSIWGGFNISLKDVLNIMKFNIFCLNICLWPIPVLTLTSIFDAKTSLQVYYWWWYFSIKYFLYIIFFIHQLLKKYNFILRKDLIA